LGKNPLSKLFGSSGEHIQPALLEAFLAELRRIRQLYELDLASRGLTLDTGAGEGAIYETDEELLADLERKENVRATYGLPAGYPVGAAIPKLDPATGREYLPEAEGPWETQEAPGAAQTTQASPFHTAALFVGPEGAEYPQE